MAAVSSIIAAVGVAAAVAGTGAQLYGSMQQAEAQKRNAALSQAAESQRKRAMDLDSSRKQLGIVREQQMMRSQALANATSQGAQFGSGLQGGYGQIQGQGGEALAGAQQNQEIGTTLFNINAQKGRNDQQISSAGTAASFGSGISTLGGIAVKDAGVVAKIGGWN